MPANASEHRSDVDDYRMAEPLTRCMTMKRSFLSVCDYIERKSRAPQTARMNDMSRLGGMRWKLRLQMTLSAGSDKEDHDLLHFPVETDEGEVRTDRGCVAFNL